MTAQFQDGSIRKRLIDLLRYIILGLGLVVATSQAKPQDEVDARVAYELMQDGKITIVDIRTPQEWRQTGVAKGAKRVNLLHPNGLQGFAQQLYEVTGADLNAPIVLICRTGSRTSKVLPILQQAGFTNIRHVPQGMIGNSGGDGWIKLGLPIEPCLAC